MSVLLRLGVIAAGLFLIFTTLKSLVKRDLAENQSLFWLFFGGVMILFGLFPWLSWTAARIFGVDYAPSIIFALALLVLLNGVFRCFRDIAALRKRTSELAMQVSLLNQENNNLLKALGELKAHAAAPTAAALVDGDK